MEKKSNLTTVNAFPKNISDSKAVEILERTDNEVENAQINNTIYYPYLVATFRVESSIMGQRDKDTIHCGVDLVNEKELLIDENPKFENQSIETNRILSKECSRESAIQTARTYIREIVNRQLKPLRTPTIQSEGSDIVHRLFYIAEIKTTTENVLQYTVDSVLGNHHRLYMETDDNLR